MAIRNLENFEVRMLNDSNNLLNNLKKSGLIESYKNYIDEKFFRAIKVLDDFKEKKIFFSDIFRLVGFRIDENKFSDAVAYLLDPNGNHGLGTKPLKSFLNSLKKTTAIKNIIDSLESNKDYIIVHRERNETNTRPDIEILCNKFIIIIENKMRYGQETFRNNEWQTDRQFSTLVERSKSIGAGENYLAIFLTPQGKEAKNKNFIPVRVNDLIKSLKIALSTEKNNHNLNSISAFLDFYCLE